MSRFVFIMEGGCVEVVINLPKPARAWEGLSPTDKDQVREAVDDVVGAYTLDISAHLGALALDN